MSPNPNNTVGIGGSGYSFQVLSRSVGFENPTPRLLGFSLLSLTRANNKNNIREGILFTYIKFFKPRGIECTLNEKIENNLLTVFNFPKKLFPVGRLDKESEGLLLMTDDGRVFNQIAISEREKEKEYRVTLDKTFDKNFLESMANGIVIMGKKTRPCKLISVNEKTFQIILTQGLNRQIRRMCYKLGYEVVELIRTRITNVELGNLKSGEVQELNTAERENLLL
ncbi:MAG: pseudouridine synthase [Bacteroidetes bacterium]|nr:pseudouridine synthase [Bacteroidota bacterium]